LNGSIRDHESGEGNQGSSFYRINSHIHLSQTRYGRAGSPRCNDHDIDLILSFINSPIKTIHASGIGLFTKSIDIANARLEFENGAIANVTSSRVSLKLERKIRFFQKDSYISLDFQAKQARVITKSAKIMKYLPQIMMGATDIDPEKLVDQQVYECSDGPQDALSMELASWVEAIRLDKRPVVDGEAGTKALSVAIQILKIIDEQLKNKKIKV
jgi:predicted dehydrogenase